MAVDVYSENFVGIISPRLSFSRDLEEDEKTSNLISDYSCKLDHSIVDSAIDSAFDFAFNVDSNVGLFPSSSADELFSNGKILPSFVKKKEIKVIEEIIPEKSVIPCLDLPSTSLTESRKKSLKEFLEDSIEEDEPNSNTAAKSFWKFRRSNSLKCDRNQRKGLIGSWKILSRSGSTGKFLEKIMEEEEKPSNFQSKFLWKFSRNNSLNNSENIDKLVIGSSSSSSSLSSSKFLRRSHSTSDHCLAKTDSKPFRRSNSTGSAPNSCKNKLKKQQSVKKQQEKQQGKNNRSYIYGNNNNNKNNLRINPVLNLPSPYISRVSVDLFKFGSLFCNSAKDRKKKK